MTSRQRSADRPRQWQAAETGLAAATGRMLGMLPAPRAAALTDGPAMRKRARYGTIGVW